MSTQRKPQSGRLINLVSLNPDLRKNSETQRGVHRLHNEIIDDSEIVEKVENPQFESFSKPTGITANQHIMTPAQSQKKNIYSLDKSPQLTQQQSWTQQRAIYSQATVQKVGMNLELDYRAPISKKIDDDEENILTPVTPVMIDNDHDEIRMKKGLSQMTAMDGDYQNKRIHFQPGQRKDPTSFLISMDEGSSLDTLKM